MSEWELERTLASHLLNISADTVKDCAVLARTLGDSTGDRLAHWILVAARVRPIEHQLYLELCNELKPEIHGAMVRAVIAEVFKFRLLKPDPRWEVRFHLLNDKRDKERICDEIDFHVSNLCLFVHLMIDQGYIDCNVIAQWLRKKMRKMNAVAFICAREICMFDDILEQREPELLESMAAYVKGLPEPLNTVWEKHRSDAAIAREGTWNLRHGAKIVREWIPCFCSDDVDALQKAVTEVVFDNQLGFIVSVVMMCLRFRAVRCLKYVLLNYPELVKDWSVETYVHVTSRGVYLSDVRAEAILSGSLEIIRLLEEHNMKFPIGDKSSNLCYYALIAHHNDLVMWLLGSQPVTFDMIVTAIKMNNIDFLHEHLVEPVMDALSGKSDDEVFKAFKVRFNVILRKAIIYKCYECVSWMLSLVKTEQFLVNPCELFEKALAASNQPIQAMIAHYSCGPWWSCELNNKNNVFHCTVRKGSIYLLKALLSQKDSDFSTYISEASNAANGDGLTPLDAAKLLQRDEMASILSENGCVCQRTDQEIEELRANGVTIHPFSRFVFLSCVRNVRDYWRTIRVSLEFLLAKSPLFFGDWVVRTKCRHGGHQVQASYPEVSEQTPNGTLLFSFWSFRFFM